MVAQNSGCLETKTGQACCNCGSIACYGNEVGLQGIIGSYGQHSGCIGNHQLHYCKRIIGAMTTAGLAMPYGACGAAGNIAMPVVCGAVYIA